MVSVATTQVGCYSAKMPQTTKVWVVWRCFNETLFTKTGGVLDLARGCSLQTPDQKVKVLKFAFLSHPITNYDIEQIILNKQKIITYIDSNIS